MIVAAIGLVPWIVALAIWLPGTAQAHHWSTAWAGLDVLEALGSAATGVLGVCRHPAHRQTAAATATLLLVDAWFDLATSAPGGAEAAALLMAVFAELPLAGLCAWLALRSPSGAARSGSRPESAEGATAADPVPAVPSPRPSGRDRAPAVPTPASRP